jgi:hypothetical protein
MLISSQISNTRDTMALQIKYKKKVKTFVLITVTGPHIIICSCEAIVGMSGMPRINCRNISNPIQNQQMVNCHIFGAPGTILTCHKNLTCAIYP